MRNQFNYSLYRCPFSHIEKDCGHELKGPEGCIDIYAVWCECGFRGPVFCFEPDDLGLKLKDLQSSESEEKLELVRLEDGQVITDFNEVFKSCDPVKQWYAAIEQNHILVTELNRRRKNIKRLVAAIKDYNHDSSPAAMRELAEAIRQAEDMESELVMGFGV